LYKFNLIVTLKKTRKGGVLLSNNSVKFGCIFFGVSSIIWDVFSIAQEEFASIFSAIGMLVACYTVGK